MKFSRKSASVYFTAILLASVISGVVFYKTVVGDDSTNILSVLFGWQWIYLCISSLIALFVAIFTNRKKLIIASGIMLFSLALVLIPARFVESSRMYITGDGGPAGPEFACLIWDNSSINLRSGAYSDSLGLCTVMSIPSYNKFLIDRSRDADQFDATATYYIMLGANQLIIVSGGWLAYKKLASKTPS